MTKMFEITAVTLTLIQNEKNAMSSEIMSSEIMSSEIMISCM